ANEPRKHSRARLQRRGHDNHTVRHGDAERPRPLSPRHRRDRPRTFVARARGTRASGNGRHPATPAPVHPRPRRRRARGEELDLALLIVNAGSSSLKLRLLGPDDSLQQSWDSLPEELPDVDVVVHRIVHGGREFSSAAFLDPDVVGKLRALTELAPLHQPKSLDAYDQV